MNRQPSPFHGIESPEEADYADDSAKTEPHALTGSLMSCPGAGNGIRTRDFDLGKVALYH